jgi:geranylgeranyl reductase family protein
LYDFIVIGGGPSGSYCAQLLSKKGFKTLQLEEHQSIGKPVECTGLVSRRVVSMVKTTSIVNRVHGANIFFPDNNQIHIGKDEETVVLERDRFDQDASALSTDNGTELLLNARVKDIKTNLDEVTVTFRGDNNLQEARGKAVIGADGANSITRKLLFPDQRFKRVVSAYQIDGAIRMEDQDSVNVYLGSQYSKGFFGWGTPAGDFSRIGTAGFGLSREKFLSLYKKFAGSNKISITGGPIPISYLKKPYANRALLVGDAAGIVKPLSGGGIYTGMVSGEKAALCLSDAYAEEDFSEKRLKSYVNMWQAELGSELRRAYFIQKLYSKISDYSFNKIGMSITSEKIRDKISKVGDIDYPSKVVISVLMRRPAIVRHILFPRKVNNEN